VDEQLRIRTLKYRRQRALVGRLFAVRLLNVRTFGAAWPLNGRIALQTRSTSVCLQDAIAEDPAPLVTKSESFEYRSTTVISAFVNPYIWARTLNPRSPGTTGMS
jgi:hypothetical protein